MQTQIKKIKFFLGKCRFDPIYSRINPNDTFLLHPDKDKLDRVTSTIVYESGEVGLFHYNKLTFLFEYFYIKNFGKRYTKEPFMKFPHGPVITNYHNQIAELKYNSLINININLLKTKRTVDDYQYNKVPITKSSDTKNAIVKEVVLHDFIKQIVERFSPLSVIELEKFVYKTKPMVDFKKKIFFKKKAGSYILRGDCIRLRDYDNPVTRGRRMALEHLRKFPDIDQEQQKKDLEEFADFEKMRPQIT